MLYDIHIRNHGENQYTVSSFRRKESTDLTSFSSEDAVAWNDEQLMDLIASILEDEAEVGEDEE